jgi:hypothetical protein
MVADHQGAGDGGGISRNDHAKTKRLRPSCLQRSARRAAPGHLATRQACPLHVGLPSDRCRLVATKTEVNGQQETHALQKQFLCDGNAVGPRAPQRGALTPPEEGSALADVTVVKLHRIRRASIHRGDEACKIIVLSNLILSSKVPLAVCPRLFSDAFMPYPCPPARPFETARCG